MEPTRQRHIDWFTDLLASRGYAPGTRRNYLGGLTLWLSHPDPTGDAQGFIDGLAARGLAPTTVRQVWAGVSCFLTVGGLSRLQLSGIPPVCLPIARNRPTRGVLSRNELSEVQSCLPVRGKSYESQRCRTLFFLLYTTGLRLGEALSIQWRDVDLAGGRLLVRAQKSGRGEFRVAILPVLELELRSLHGFGRLVWVFSARHADLPAGPSAARQLRRLIHRLAPGRCIHSLRHSFITHLIEEGVPLPIVQRLARHRKLQTTLGYTHLTDLQAEAELRQHHPWAKRED